MQTKPRAGSVITHRWDPATPHLISFIVAGAGETTLDLLKVAPDNLARFSRHGALQRVNDAAAKARGPENGKSATPESKLAAMERLVEHYNSGAEGWGPERDGGGGPGLDGTVLAAVAEATKRSVDDVREMVRVQAEEKKVTQRDYLAQLATAKAVVPILAKMRKAKSPGLDANEELAAMMG